MMNDHQSSSEIQFIFGYSITAKIIINMIQFYEISTYGTQGRYVKFMVIFFFFIHWLK